MPAVKPCERRAEETPSVVSPYATSDSEPGGRPKDQYALGHTDSVPG